MPGYDQNEFASVNSIGAGLFTMQQGLQHVTLKLRLSNECEVQQLRSYWLCLGIVVESVVPANHW